MEEKGENVKRRKERDGRERDWKRKFSWENVGRQETVKE